MGKLLTSIKNFFHVLFASNPLDDKLYPWLLDRYGHATARRVCSAIAIAFLLTFAVPFALCIWIYNSALDLLINIGYGWAQSLKDHVSGVVTGGIDKLDGGDPDAWDETSKPWHKA